MRFSSGRPAIPDAEGVGRVEEVQSDHRDLCLPTTLLGLLCTGASICWPGESRFGLKSLDPRSLGSSAPLSFQFSI